MNTAKSFMQKVFYSVSANMLNLLVSVLTTLIIPKFLGDDIAQYGYFQIYLFYIGYIGFFHLGWCDGIYLRDGGKEYNQLDKALYSGQFWLLTLSQIGIAFTIIILSVVSQNDINYVIIYCFIALSIVVFLPRTMLSYYLQTTNRIKEYAYITMGGRIAYGLCCILIVIILSENYIFFIVADIIGKSIGLFIACWWCRDIIFTKPEGIRKICSEAIINIRVGINLLIANISSMLITGIVRFGIQTKWDVETYGKISLTLSVSNLLLTFISAISLVLYPNLRKLSLKRLNNLYVNLCASLMIPLLGCMAFYYPLEKMIMLWLPQYSDGLKYMAILFPVCIYSAKMSMIVQTYMKVYRLEKTILKVNFLGVCIAFITTGICIFLLENLTLAILSIVVNQMIRCNYAEIVLGKTIQLNIGKDILYENILVVLFIYSNWIIGGILGISIYAVGYIVYLLVNKSKVKFLLISCRKQMEVLLRK